MMDCENLHANQLRCAALHVCNKDKLCVPVWQSLKNWDSNGVKSDSPDIARDTVAAITMQGNYLQAQLKRG